jgi:hypothetical protein
MRCGGMRCLARSSRYSLLERDMQCLVACNGARAGGGLVVARSRLKLAVRWHQKKVGSPPRSRAHGCLPGVSRMTVRVSVYLSRVPAAKQRCA